MLKWKHVFITLSHNCVVITVHETLFYTLMQFNGQMLWSPRTPDNITCNRRVQAWDIRLYCYLTQCFGGTTTQMIQILWLLSHPRREGIWDLHIHVFSGFFLISSGTIMWNMHDGEPTACIKFINLHKKSRQNLSSKYVTKRSSHQFYQTPIKTRNASVPWYKVMIR